MCPPYTSHQPPAILHCTCTHTPAPSPAALPHLDVPIHPWSPLPGGIFTTNHPNCHQSSYSCSTFYQHRTSAHLCPPSHTPSPLGASPSLRLSPLSDFPLTSDPLPATTGNPALVQPGTAPILDLCITNPHGPHAAHLPSLWACTTHIAIQGSGLARSPVAEVAPIFHCGKPCNRLTNYSIPWPMGREILLSGQDSDLSSLGAYEGSALRGG